MEPNISWARSIDCELKSLAKKFFKLPKRTATPFFYSQTRAGGLALPNIEDEIHPFRISTVYKVLFAQGDDQLRDISTSALGKTTTEIRTQNRKSAQIFLNDPANPVPEPMHHNHLPPNNAPILRYLPYFTITFTL
ncbi:hypothetical protein EMCRGX_G005425 [Ephydatia muelleri]